MQKIIIKNFGPIKDAEIEIKNILVLIGEQASGKSTVAKLIYFFKSLGDDFYDLLVNLDPDLSNIEENFTNTIRAKFYSFFRATYDINTFRVKFFFDKSTFIEIGHINPSESAFNSNLIKVNFSDNFFEETFLNKLSIMATKCYDVGSSDMNASIDSVEQRLIKQEWLNATQEITKFIHNFFSTQHSSSLYLVAGRETTVSSENIFNAYYESIRKSQLDDKRKNITKINDRSTDENLLFEFLKHVMHLKNVFSKYGGNISSVVNNLKNGSIIDAAFIEKINLILKGEYRVDNLGEKLIFRDGNYVYLKDASSGQKEVIRIIQDLVLIILEKQNALRIIEEPEAHLFPVAQKQLVELLVYMKNYNPNNQIIITTHSPYILTVLNNLLFASRVVKKSPHSEEEVAKMIPKVFRINPNDFAAYSLGNSLDEDAEYCEDIFNKETGVIMQNFLDIVSEMLGGDFNFLYSLHAKNLRAVS